MMTVLVEVVLALLTFGDVIHPTSRGPRSIPLFQLLQRFWPIILEQPRKRPIREQFAAGLAFRAVIRFVLRVDNALNRRAAYRVVSVLYNLHSRWLRSAPRFGPIPSPVATVSSCPQLDCFQALGTKRYTFAGSRMTRLSTHGRVDF